MLLIKLLKVRQRETKARSSALKSYSPEEEAEIRKKREGIILIDNGAHSS